MTDIQRFLDQQQMTYLMVTLTKLRYEQRISRSTVAERMGVTHLRITEFDERKTPWDTVSVWFLQQYARAVGVKLEVGFITQQGADDGGELSDEGRSDNSDPVHDDADTQRG